jgi:eukaryotic-like serine/threonine-protein kinase
VIDVRDDLVTALAGRYDIERELGHGGMAVVYLARDVRHDRHVAIKALRPELATTLGAERFLREINIAARLTHPNILALHDSGEAAGMLYFVMPHVEGETLRERLVREHQLPMEEALAITRQIGLALDYAHQRGVVHRDIKPDNILLLGDHVLVADFGLARALHTAGTQRLTESAVAVGTPAYMSPEQAAADPDVDGRADLYSLACVLFEMIAGMPPFRGANSAAVLAQHMTATPPSICAQRPHCPPNVDAAVARALEKNPADRFRTAGEFAAALSIAPAAWPSPAPSAATEVRARRRPSRTQVAAWAGGIIAVAAVLIAAKMLGPQHSHPLDRRTFAVVPLIAVDQAARADSAALTRGVSDA